MPSMKILNVWALTGEIGFLLALPLVILVPLAVKLDKMLGTLPLCIIGSLILSMVVSMIAVNRKIKQVTQHSSSLDKGRPGGISAL